MEGDMEGDMDRDRTKKALSVADRNATSVPIAARVQ
jgi:hypothetical protein